jgi:hypothetical protein
MTTKRRALATGAITLVVLMPAAAFAATRDATTRTDVTSLATAESKVVTLLHSYKATAAWKAQYKAAVATQATDLVKLNSALAVLAPPAAVAATTPKTGVSTAATTQADVTSLAAAESRVVALLHAYQPAATWKAKFKAAEAVQTPDLAALNAVLNPTSALFALTGSGSASTAKFTVPASAKGWRLVWSYNCSAFGSAGNFAVVIKGGSGKDQAINQLGKKGSGVEHYDDVGTFNLQVDSECNWSIQAVAGD